MQVESMRVSLEEMKKSQEETQSNLKEKTHQWENQQLSLQQLTSTFNQTQEKLTAAEQSISQKQKECQGSILTYQLKIYKTLVQKNCIRLSHMLNCMWNNMLLMYYFQNCKIRQKTWQWILVR